MEAVANEVRKEGVRDEESGEEDVSEVRRRGLDDVPHHVEGVLIDLPSTGGLGSGEVDRKSP